MLDVSVTEIDLGTVEAYEALPPERVVVRDPGEGDLGWSAQCAAEWVTLERDRYGLILGLRPPGPGPWRANVEVVDERTGTITIIRLSVSVLPATHRPNIPAASGARDARPDDPGGPHERPASPDPVALTPFGEHGGYVDLGDGTVVWARVPEDDTAGGLLPGEAVRILVPHGEPRDCVVRRLSGSAPRATNRRLDGHIGELPVQQAKSRLLVTLVLDTSSSMAASGAIHQLNAGLNRFRRELQGNDYVLRTGELAIVTFGWGHVQIVDPAGQPVESFDQPFVPISRFRPPLLEAGGVTPMIEGIQQAFQLVLQRKAQIRTEGLLLAHRPLVFMFTDGQPTDLHGYRSDGWKSLGPIIRDLEFNKHLLFFPIGVQGADEMVLSELGPLSYKMIDDVDFSATFGLVSASMDIVVSPRHVGNETAEEIYNQVTESLSKQQQVKDFLDSQATGGPDKVDRLVDVEREKTARIRDFLAGGRA